MLVHQRVPIKSLLVCPSLSDTEALQKVLQNLTHAVQNIGAEAHLTGLSNGAT
jgi:hypothetical protein